MGKIRIKTLGLPEEEEKQKEKVQLKKEGKKARLKAGVKKNLPAGRQAKAPGLKGGEKLPSMGPTEEELAAIPIPPSEVKEEAPAEVKEEVKTQRAPKKRGQKYQKAAKLIDKNRFYPLLEALDLVKKASFVRFDGSIEAHINTLEKGVSGSLKLPHGSGKEVRVAIADEKVLSQIESGKIDFDVLLSAPEFMPKLAKFAKILGPRGLMPNPKAGTLSEDPEKVAEKFKAGEIRFKTEAQAPLIHLTIGRVSFSENYLEENLKAAVSAIGISKIQKLTLSSTMGPGIKVDLTTV